MNITKSIGTKAKGVIRFLKHDWGKRSVIGIPYLFLILLFSVPFLVVLKLSVSETDGIRFEDIDKALSVPESDLRLFGKPASFKRRRMGVALASADTIDEARARAQKVSSLVKTSV